MRSTTAGMIALAAGLLALAHAPDTAAAGNCRSGEASKAYKAGYQALRENRNADSIRQLERCLELDDRCTICRRTLGWAHWSRSEWDRAIAVWQRILDDHPSDAKARKAIASARTNARLMPSLRVPMGQSVRGSRGAALELVGRMQAYKPVTGHKADHYDEQVHSPKSARFSADGKKVYVNALEGKRTLIYDARSLAKLGTVEHTFRKQQRSLFAGESTLFDYRYSRKSPQGHPNHFRGKPVESELSHGGKLLWVPYYRRDFDRWSTSPSAVAIIDTATDAIVRVMPTGPIPKYVVASPDDNWVAVIHWGDNTVALIDTSSGDPAKFRYTELMSAGERLDLGKIPSGVSRDSVCGYCLRGAVFTPDSKVLLVARMSGGGIVGFDVASGKKLGTVSGMKPTPRHLALSPDGASLYLTSNSSGYLSKIALEDLVDALRSAGGRTVRMKGWQETDVGKGARTVSLSPDGNYAFVAANLASKLVMVDTRTMTVAASVRADSYPVGLAVSPDGRRVWVTSQGRSGKNSGNSVLVFDVTYPR